MTINLTLLIVFLLVCALWLCMTRRWLGLCSLEMLRFVTLSMLSALVPSEFPGMVTCSGFLVLWFMVRLLLEVVLLVEACVVLRCLSEKVKFVVGILTLLLNVLAKTELQ